MTPHPAPSKSQSHDLFFHTRPCSFPSSCTVLLAVPWTYQVHSHLRIFVVSLFYFWNALPTDILAILLTSPLSLCPDFSILVRSTLITLFKTTTALPSPALYFLFLHSTSVSSPSIIPWPPFFFWPSRMACGILIHQPGIEPGPLAVRARSPNHGTAREFPILWFFYKVNC